MEIDELLEPRVHIVSGKGGVGKTTVAAALALVAARSGRRVCIAEVDRKGTLARLLGGAELTYDPKEIAPDVWGLNIVPESALVEYLDVQYHMKRLSWAFTSTHFVDYITTAAPGLKDILILGKIWFLEQGRTTKVEFDTIIVDAPAAGHMLQFLSAPSGLSDALRVGPLRRQADWLVEMLQDPKRTRVHLATLAEEMPVSETIETSAALTEKLGLNQGLVFANAIYSELLTEAEDKILDTLIAQHDTGELVQEAAKVNLILDDQDLEAIVGYARFVGARRDIQRAYLEDLRKGLDQPIVELPFLFSAGLALPDVETLADVIEEQSAKI